MRERPNVVVDCTVNSRPARLLLFFCFAGNVLHISTLKCDLCEREKQLQGRIFSQVVSFLRLFRPLWGGCKKKRSEAIREEETVGHPTPLSISPVGTTNPNGKYCPIRLIDPRLIGKPYKMGNEIKKCAVDMLWGSSPLCWLAGLFRQSHVEISDDDNTHIEGDGLDCCGDNRISVRPRFPFNWQEENGFKYPVRPTPSTLFFFIIIPSNRW